ncbi:hypothetical protein [Amycolatopsis sp. cmx-11-32]|uniref:hypothetical protein n=1 Tax=Amycolatopsis sp. cmx-11-32 TaxID=2785796 RepID=UPI0039E725D9
MSRPEMAKNFEFFIVHLMKAIGSFTPGLRALKASRTRIVVGVGETSAAQLVHEAAVLAAGLLGVSQPTSPVTMAVSPPTMNGPFLTHFC